MTIRYRNSGLYDFEFSSNPFFKEQEINLNVTNIDKENISKEVSYDIDIYSEYYEGDKEQLKELDYYERKQHINEKFWEALSFRNKFYIPENYNPRKALECGLTPFKYKEIGMLAYGEGDTSRANLDAYQFATDNSLDRHSVFCESSSSRDDIALKSKVGGEMLEQILEKVSELKKIEAEKNKEIEEYDYER